FGNIVTLRTPDRGCGEVLVDARLKLDVMALEVRLRAPQRLVEPAERRAAVAGDKARGVQPGHLVARALQHQQADERLRAGQEHAPALDGVLVLEGEFGEVGGSVHRLGIHYRPNPDLALMRGLTTARSQKGSGPNELARKSMKAR